MPKVCLPHRVRLVGAGLVLSLAAAGCATEEAGEPQDTDAAPASPQTPSPEPTDADPTDSETAEPTETEEGAQDEEDQDEQDPDAPVLDQQGVSAAHPEAVAVGEEVLAEGGNAVDAAVATAFAISVVEPFASGIGGGGATLLAGPDVDPVNYDYREEVAGDGEIPETGTGVPGFVAGMAELHAQHGSLEWEDLLEAPRVLAAEGFEVSEFLELRMREDFGPAAVEDMEEFAPGSDPLSAGDTLVQEDLAATIGRLAEEGAQDFYTGDLAGELAEIDGLDARTLDAYEVLVDEPASGALDEYELLSAAPPLPGAAVIQQMQLAEADDIAAAEPGSAAHILALAQSWETALETAETELGDPRFIDVPVEEITDAGANTDASAGAGSLGLGTDAAQAGLAELSAQGTAGERPEPRSTTHITVVDEDGLMVSMTNTITNFWGSGESVGGFFLNNQLSRFDAVDSPANQPEPGRRSVSWAAPSMVLDGEGRPVLGIGTPGGPQIPNILAEVLTRWALQGRSLDQAVEAPRSHLDDDTLLLESEPARDTLDALEDRGFDVEVTTPEQAVFGSVQALEVDYDESTVIGVDDTRREGAHRILD